MHGTSSKGSGTQHLCEVTKAQRRKNGKVGLLKKMDIVSISRLERSVIDNDVPLFNSIIRKVASDAKTMPTKTHPSDEEDTKFTMQLTPLHLACSKGHGEIINEIFKHEFSTTVHLGTVHDVDCNKRTPLHHAAMSKNGENVINVLISSGSRIDAVDHNGQTPLHLALEWGRLWNFQMILNSIEDSDTAAKSVKMIVDCKNQTIFTLLLKNGAFGLAKALMDQGGWAETNFLDCTDVKYLTDRLEDIIIASSHMLDKIHVSDVDHRRSSFFNIFD